MTAETTPALGSGAMFDAIAHRYDLLNRILSLGLDNGWRRATVAALEVNERSRALDLATGTGDLALLLAKHAGAVVGLDPSERMLAIAEQKIGEAGLAERVSLVVGDAQKLPHDDASFDAVSMAFGIRNVPDRAAALAEIHRVLEPGGRVAILELSEPRSGLFGAPVRLYVRQIVPLVGAILSGASEYRYLQRSIRAFPAPAEFQTMMTEAGFVDTAARKLTFGACVLFTGVRS